MTDRLTPEREAEIAMRDLIATKGPWGLYESGTMIDVAADLEETGCGYRARREIARFEDEPLDNDPTHREWTAEEDWEQVRIDAEFVAHARTDVPVLLAELSAVRAERDTAHAELEQLRTSRWDATKVVADLESRLHATHAVLEGQATPPTDRAALRDRIAAAIYERNNPGYQWADAHPDDRLAYGFDADAVLAVLPSAADWDDLVREADRLRRDGTALHARAEELDTQLTALRRQVAEPTDRAAVLDLDAIAARAADAQQYGIEDDGFEQLVREDVPALITALRRMADETATETPETPTVAWHILTHQRGTWRPWLAPRDNSTEAREDYDRCVSDNGHRWAFRLVRETSTFTVESEHQPAAGARQDGAET